MGTEKRYPKELRERAVKLVAESRSDHESEWALRYSALSPERAKPCIRW